MKVLKFFISNHDCSGTLIKTLLTGKTYTMMGDSFEAGIIPQAVNLIFDRIDNSHGRQFLLRYEFLKINTEVNQNLFVNYS